MVKFFIQRENGVIKRVCSSSSLGGFLSESVRNEDTTRAIRVFLISTYGTGWKLDNLDESDESEEAPDVGYSKEVREFCISNNLITWGKIEMYDRIVERSNADEKGFAGRYFPFKEKMDYDSEGNHIPFDQRERLRMRKREEEEGGIKKKSDVEPFGSSSVPVSASVGKKRKAEDQSEGASYPKYLLYEKGNNDNREITGNERPWEIPLNLKEFTIIPTSIPIVYGGNSRFTRQEAEYAVQMRKQILSSEYGIKFLQEKKRRLELEGIIRDIGNKIHGCLD